MIDLRGVFPPLPTSFTANDDLATDKLQENISYLNRFDLSGYLILGSNGELVNLSEEEKIEVYQSARKVIPANKLMLAGTGGQSTREAIRLSQAAAKAGADAALVLNPSYYKGLMTRQVLIRHYHDIADNTSIPIIIYNMPANSGMDMDAETVVSISRHPNIIGVKDSGGNLGKMAQIIHDSEESFQVLAGSAGFLLPALSIGAVGGILALANIAPEECLSLYKNFTEGRFDEAMDMQRKMIQVNDAVTRGWGVPALKAAMDHIGLYGGPCRRPIADLDEAKKNQVFELLKDLKSQ
jgi:4-hydroxy-2-oxoglutarate aldolase